MAYQDYGNELDMLQGQIEQAGPQQPQPTTATAQPYQNAYAPEPEPYTGGLTRVSDISPQQLAQAQQMNPADYGEDFTPVSTQMPDRGDIWSRPSRGQPGQGRGRGQQMRQLQRRRQMAKQWLGQSGRPSPMRDRAVAGPGGVPTNPMIKAQGGQMERLPARGGGGFPTQARGNAWGRSNRFQMGRSPAMGRKFQKGFSNQYNQLLGTTAGGPQPTNLQPDSDVRQRIGAMTTNRMPAGGGMASTNRMPAGGGMATNNRVPTGSPQTPGAPPPSSPQPSGGVVGPQQGGASVPGAGGGGAAGGNALRDKIAARRKALMAAQGR